MKRFVFMIAALLSALTLFGCTAYRTPEENGGDFPLDEIVTPDVPLSPEGSGGGEENTDDPKDKPEIFDVLLESTANGLNVRSGAGTGFSSLGTLDKGDMVAFIGESGEWYETVYREKKAYISKKYAKKCSFSKGSDAVESVIEIGKTLLGHPYVWGAQRYHWGNGKLNSDFKAGEFDCSSLMQYIYFLGADVKLDVNTRTQVLQGETVDSLRRGDLLFFTNASRVDKTGIERVGHVALYLGDGVILHTASDHAVIETMSEQRKTYFLIAKRFLL